MCLSWNFNKKCAIIQIEDVAIPHAFSKGGVMMKLKYIPFLIVAISSLTLMNSKVYSAPINASNTQPSSSTWNVNQPTNEVKSNTDIMRSDTSNSDLMNSQLHQAPSDNMNLNSEVQRTDLNPQSNYNQDRLDQKSTETQLKSDMQLNNVPNNNSKPNVPNNSTSPTIPKLAAVTNTNFNLHENVNSPDTIRSDNFDDKSVHAPFPVKDNKVVPSEKLTIVDLASTKPELSIFVQAVKAADLVTVLNGKGPFTVFAPTNEAFDKLPAGKLQELMKPENKEKLRSLLVFHVIPDKVVKTTDIKSGEEKTVNGKELDFKVSGSTVMVNDAKVIRTDLVGSNGIIHEIDTVLVP